ncbi:MAG: YitT family protein, partial [Clostridia bacterium]|nr:YitT family protein [Clostridia bacterium]
MSTLISKINEGSGKKRGVFLVLRSYLFVTLGCLVYSFGIVALIQPLQIVNGGITGILNLVNIITPIHVGIFYFIINIPLLITSYIVFGWRFTVGTVYGTLVNSAMITAFETLLKGYALTNDILIGSFCGGAMLGVGLGVIMRFGASTGGSDIIMKLLHRKKPYLSGGIINTIIDVAILIAYFIVMRDFDKTFYAVLTVLVENTIYDLVLYGTMGSKTVYIITDRP